MKWLLKLFRLFFRPLAGPLENASKEGSEILSTCDDYDRRQEPTFPNWDSAEPV